MYKRGRLDESVVHYYDYLPSLILKAVAYKYTFFHKNNFYKNTRLIFAQNLKTNQEQYQPQNAKNN